MNSLKQVNTSFRAFCRENNIELRRGKPQNEQPADTRMVYVDYIDSLERSGVISRNLANNSHYK